MLTGELRSRIDTIWDAFWSGGISNPLEVIEQITYLIFIRGLDQVEQREENRANTLKQPMRRRIFPEGKDGVGADGGVEYDKLRWSRLTNVSDARQLFALMGEHVFPFLRSMAEEGSAHATHMKGARFTIPSPQLLVKVVDLIDKLPLDDRDAKGDLYEYMLAKIASAGANGQFRTPRHIIRLMVEMTAPQRDDVIVDPACGTCGFLVGAAEYLRDNDAKLFTDLTARDHFNQAMFHGFDFDQTMLRIGSMNMTLHGVDDPDIRYKDSLSEEHAGDEDKYSLVLANPPFAGSLDADQVAKDLYRTVKTKKTELLFMALFLKLLKPGGRAAVIVPDGVLFGSSTAHKEIRRLLVEDHRLDAIVKLPSGVFRPYAGVSTAIVFFTKTNSGGTDNVWFYDCQADGFSLDDKRTQLLADDKTGPVPGREENHNFVNVTLTDDELLKNNLPDIAARWADWRAHGASSAEASRPRTAQSFLVPKADIVAAGYDLSLNRYKEVVHEAVDHRPPKDIIAELKALETEIAQGLDELEAML